MDHKKEKIKTGPTKLWRALSKDSPEVIWIRARTKPEVKKLLRGYLRSTEYWEGEPAEEVVKEIFDSYSADLKDCPGLRVDDTRGDVMISLTDPSADWIYDRNKERTKKKRENRV